MDESLDQELPQTEATPLALRLRRAFEIVRQWIAAHSAGVLCGLLLSAMSLSMLSVIARKSITNDEIVMIPSAYYHLAAGDLQVTSEHPPLSKILAGLPLLFIQPNEGRASDFVQTSNPGDRTWQIQAHFWHTNSHAFRTISFWSRVPAIALTAALGILIFVFARELFGARTAVLAVALFALEPTVLAHGRVVQTDIPAAFGYLLVVFTLYHYLRLHTWQRAAWVGIASGIALLGKFSMVIIAPLLVAVFLWLLWRTPGGRRARAAHALVTTLASLLVVNAAYYFSSRALTANDAQWVASAFPSSAQIIMTSVGVLSHLVPTDFVLGIYWQLWHSRQGHPASLLGMYSETGWWYYFPVAFALKTTIPSLLLSVAALAWAAYQTIRKRDQRFLILLAPFVVYTVFVMMSNINIGVRYFLPAYPLLFIMGAALLDRLLRLNRARAAGLITVVALLGWCGLEAARAYPNYMPYLNQLARGRPHWWYLSDSNVEWGDDVGELAAYLRSRGERRVRAIMLGGFITLRYYGVEHVDLLSPEADSSQTRYVAIGASFLNGSTVPGYQREGVIVSEEQRVNSFDSFRRRTPEAVIGNSIYLYRMHE